MPDPADRRGVHVRLTPRGKERVDAALADLLARERDLLSALPARQQETLSGLLRQLVAPFESDDQSVRRPRSGPRPGPARRC